MRCKVSLNRANVEQTRLTLSQISIFLYASLYVLALDCFITISTSIAAFIYTMVVKQVPSI